MQVRSGQVCDHLVDGEHAVSAARRRGLVTGGKHESLQLIATFLQCGTARLGRCKTGDQFVGLLNELLVWVRRRPVQDSRGHGKEPGEAGPGQVDRHGNNKVNQSVRCRRHLSGLVLLRRFLLLLLGQGRLEHCCYTTESLIEFLPEY